MWAAPELSEEEGGHHDDLSSLRRAGRLPIRAVPGNPPDSYAPAWIAIRPAPPFASYYPARSVPPAEHFEAAPRGWIDIQPGIPARGSRDASGDARLWTPGARVRRTGGGA